MRIPLGLSVVALLCLVCAAGASSQVPLEGSPFWMSAEENVYSTGISWRDCNNDGYIDVFFSNGNDMNQAQNFIYLSNYGTLPATASWYSSNYQYSGHCAVGDIDDNGYPDFAVSNFIGGYGWDPTISNIYLNPDGRPNHNPDWYTDDSLFTFSCVLGDFDGDGDLDLAMATGMSYGGPALPECIFFNIDGVMQTSPGWQSDDSTEALDVTCGDIDNDGDLDLAFCYDDRGAAVYYNHSGTIETTPSWQSTVADPANTIIFADIDGDGWLDLIIACNSQTGGQGFYYAYYNNGTGVLATSPGWQSADGGFGSAVSVYDYDNDGDDDLAAGRWWDQPRIYENLGGSFSSTPVWRAGEATVVEEIAWIDVDGDGLEARSDTFYVAGDRKLFYTLHHPLQSIDSVKADGLLLTNADYCFDLISGWVSLGTAPSESIIIYYQCSFKNDLTISNWDTYNMAYGNSAKPFVEFYADVTFGKAPLTVHFSDSSAGASDWLWRFGDGGVADVGDPVHTFSDGGAFDIYLENTLPDGRHNRTIKKMIIALADTVYFPEVVSSPGDTVKVPIYLRNCHPLHYFLLPIIFDGPVQLQFLDFDTDSCRTDYFDRVDDVAYYPAGHQIVFSFLPTYINYNPPLEPGYGRLINLYFLHQSGSGTTILDTATLSTKSLYYDASYVNYQPAIRNGYVASSQVMRGDANGDLTINLLDATFLIDYLYRNGPAPDPYAGDADASRNINILDVSYLINYLYKDGPPPIK